MPDSLVPTTALPLFAALDEALIPMPTGRLVVAFSGGPDSTSLLASLVDWCRAQPRPIQLVAAHLDHGLDTASANRATAAKHLADQLGVTFRLGTAQIRHRPGHSLEAVARAHRYRFLESLRRELQADWILTGHHAEDQAETLALRLLHGTSLRGMAGIRHSSGRVRRPFLGLRRSQLLADLDHRQLKPVEDVTNQDPAIERNLVRHHLLPYLEDGIEAGGSSLAPVASRLAETAQRAFRSIDQRLLVELRPKTKPRVCQARLEPLLGWPEPVQDLGFSLLLRLAGQATPLPRSLATELRNSLREKSTGRFHRRQHGDWAWSRAQGSISVSIGTGRPGQDTSACLPFAYTLTAPGKIRIPEINADVSVDHRLFEPWMLRGSKWRAALALPLGPGDRLVVRNRKAGDRIRPLGAPGRRRLKDILIDHRVPRSARDRLPLLCWQGRIVWVPGITIENEFRLKDESPTWVCQIEKLAPTDESGIAASKISDIEPESTRRPPSAGHHEGRGAHRP